MKLIDRKQLQEKLLMSRSALYTAMANGALPRPIKFGEKMLWEESEIDQIIIDKLKDGKRQASAA